MPRTTRDEPASTPAVYRCINAFSVFRGGVPLVYGSDSQVLGTDPILETHRDHFEPIADRLVARRGVEQATAVPGQLRAAVLPPPAAPAPVQSPLVKGPAQ